MCIIHIKTLMKLNTFFVNTFITNLKFVVYILSHIFCHLNSLTVDTYKFRFIKK